MLIYLLRHGIAEDSGPGVPDSKRQLTPEGRKKLGLVLKLAKNAGVTPELIVSSPLVRAVQTAEIAREILGVEAAVQESPLLIPEGNPREVWAELQGLRNLEAVLLTGHEPLMSTLAASLLGSPSLLLHMRKGAMVCIEMENMRGEPHGILQWMALARMGG